VKRFLLFAKTAKGLRMRFLFLFLVMGSAYGQTMISGSQIMKNINAKVSCYSAGVKIFGPMDVYNVETTARAVMIYNSKQTQDLKSPDAIISNAVCVSERI